MLKLTEVVKYHINGQFSWEAEESMTQDFHVINTHVLIELNVQSTIQISVKFMIIA